MSYTTITRVQAAHDGLTYFYTGRPCKYGHLDRRFVSTGTCAACNRLARGKYKRVPNKVRSFTYTLHIDDEPSVRALVNMLGVDRAIAFQPGAGEPAPAAEPMSDEEATNARIAATRARVMGDG